MPKQNTEQCFHITTAKHLQSASHKSGAGGACSSSERIVVALDSLGGSQGDVAGLVVERLVARLVR